MARPLRIEFPGAIYHVTSRSDRREAIFEDDVDRRAFLEVVSQALERFDAVALAYCLMHDHYHFVLQTRRANLSQLMRQINGVYTQAYNRRHDKAGHLFRGRFKGILVDPARYLLEVCRYVDLNPIRARMVRASSNWPWSSYTSHVGSVPPPDWLDTAAVHGHLLGHPPVARSDARKAAERYAALVAAGKGVALWDQALSKQIFLGDQAFVARMQARFSPAKAGSKEVRARQHRTGVKPLKHYLDRAANRDAGIRAALREGHYSLTAIAGAVGLSVSRVSRIVQGKENDAH
ncbi:MAG: transposase [Burkholderiales bacterium]